MALGAESESGGAPGGGVATSEGGPEAYVAERASEVAALETQVRRRSWNEIYYGAPEEFEVILHVYSVSRSHLMLQANKALDMVGSGIFHAGVEINGTEWSFNA